MQKWLFLFLILGAFPLYLQEQKIGCNEALCASIVSKCMLTQSCKCNIKQNATCSRECFLCLDYLYSECCDCVDMCPKPNITDTELGQKSHVEEFSQSEPALFAALTEEKDRLLRWTSYTFLSRITLFNSVHNEEIKLSTVPIDEHSLPVEDRAINCTVAFLSQCMSFGKCRDSCLSMGASSCRWFHDGCCECVGSTCLNYGMNEGRCLQCPKEIDDDDNDESVVVYSNGTEKPEEEEKKNDSLDKEEKKNDSLDKEDNETKEEALQEIDS